MSRRIVAAVVVAVCMTRPAPVTAQADSLSAVARARYRDAVAAEKKGDLAGARDFLARATEAWPMQPFYPLAAAEVAARLGDTAGAVRMLTRYADLGAGIDLRESKSFGSLLGAPALEPVRKRLAENLTPLVRSDSVAGIPDPEFYPEGMDYDPGSRSWFVASIRKRTIARIGPDGRAVDFPKLSGGRLDAVLGVRVDSRHGVVWASTKAFPAMEGYQRADSGRASVWALSLATGEVLGRADAPAGAPHLFGDLVVHPSGDVYLSDSESPILYRARLANGKVLLEERLRHRTFRSLQGLAFDDAGSRLYLADYSHGLLLVNLETGSVTPVAVPAGASTLGLDGIARSGRLLIAVQNGLVPPRIVRMRLAADGASIESFEVIDRHLPLADEPTIGAIVGDRFVYVANSHWEKYDDAGHPKDGARLRSPVLLSVPIGR